VAATDLERRLGCGAVQDARDRCFEGVAGLRGDLVGLSFAVAMKRDRVDHERIADQVEVLAGVADAMGSSDPKGIVDAAVDGFRVEAPRVEPGEVRRLCCVGAGPRRR